MSMGARKRVVTLARQATWDGGNDSLELIPGLCKRLKITSLLCPKYLYIL
jgi:hypothetical protein